jgi:pimeloyl-ACP methyl ester carboxylesterase
MGHSFGGKTGVIVASKIPLKKLILVDASGVESKTMLTQIKISFAKIFKLFPFRNIILEKIASTDYKEAGELLPSFKKIVRQDVLEDAKKVSIPTVIIWGDKDTEVPVNASKIFRSLIKNSLIRIVWGSNHHPHIEKPEKFISLLNEIL